MKSKAAILANQLNRLDSEACAKDRALSERRQSAKVAHAGRIESIKKKELQSIDEIEQRSEQEQGCSNKRVKEALSKGDEARRTRDAKRKELIDAQKREAESISGRAKDQIASIKDQRERYEKVRDSIPEKYSRKFACSKFESNSSDLQELFDLLSKVLDDTLWATMKGVLGAGGYSSRKSMAFDLCYKVGCSIEHLNDQIQLAKDGERRDIDSSLKSLSDKLDEVEAAYQKELAAIEGIKAREADFRRQEDSSKSRKIEATRDAIRSEIAAENEQFSRECERFEEELAEIQKAYEDNVESLDLGGFLRAEFEKMRELGAERSSWKNPFQFSLTSPPAFPFGFIGYEIRAAGKRRSCLEHALGPCLSEKALSGFAYDISGETSSYWIEYMSGSTAHIAGIRFIIAAKARLMPHEMLRVVFCDPKMKGMNLGWLKEWANDARGRVVFTDVATTSSEIEACLRRENENLGGVGTTIPPYNNVAEYNASNPSSPIPTTLIVVNDVDDEFLSPYSLETLRAIAVNGSNFGYEILVTSQPSTGCEDGPKQKALEKLKTALTPIVEISQGSFKLDDGNTFAFFEDDYVTRDFIQAFADEYHRVKRAKDEQVIEVDIAEFITSDGKSTTGRKHIKEADGQCEGISVPFAIDQQGNMVEFKIGRQPDYHVLVTGSIGSGKSNFFHMIVNGIAANYYPDEVELWLMEFKGVDFSTYRDTRLPHVKLIGLSEDGDFRHSLFEKIELEFKVKRTALLDAAHVKRIDEYNALEHKPSCCPGYPDGCPDYLPHVILIIDELGVISKQFDADEARLFTEMLALYRSHGLYVLMANQTVDTKKPLVEEFENVRGRIGLSNHDDNEFRKLFPGDYSSSGMPSAYSLKRGQAVQYSNGRYALVQIPYIDQDTIKAVSSTAMNEFGPRDLVLVEQNDPRPAYNAELIEELVKGQAQKSGIMDCFVGQTISLVNPYKPIQLEKDFFQNVLVIGNNEELKYSIAVAFALNVIERGGTVAVISQKRSRVHYAYEAFCATFNCQFEDTSSGIVDLLDSIDERKDPHVPALLIIDSGSALIDEMELQYEESRLRDLPKKPPRTEERDSDAAASQSCSPLSEEEAVKRRFEEQFEFRKQLREAQERVASADSETSIDDIRRKLLVLIKRGSSEGIHCCWTDTTDPEFSSKNLFGRDWGSRKTSQVFAHRFITALGRQDASIARNLGFGEQPLDMPQASKEKVVVYSDKIGNVLKLKPFIMPWSRKESYL